jgi:hypothetical protein
MVVSIAVFLIAAIGGWILGGNLPNGALRESWRLPLGARLVAIGLAIGVMAVRGAFR